MPVSNEALNKASNGLDNTVLRSLRIITGMLKGPVALLDFKLIISHSISFAVVGKIQKLSHDVFFEYSKGDISIFGIEQARFFPIFAK